MEELRFKGTLFDRTRGIKAIRVETFVDVPWTEAGVLEAFAHGVEAHDKHQQQLWNAGEFHVGATRCRAGIKHIHSAILDKDCADVGEFDRVIRWLNVKGLAAVVYTSWSHGKPEKTPNDQPDLKGPFDCFRIVLPFSRPVTDLEYTVLVEALFGHEVPHDPPHYRKEVLGKLVMTPSGKERAARPRGWDPVSTRPTQGYFIPAPHSELEVYPGRPLPVEDILARPTTARISEARALRKVRPATRDGLGALESLDRALERFEFFLAPEGTGGWFRAVCPSCQDKSASLQARADGDGVYVRCWAGCSRAEILSAVGLEGDKWRAPSDLRAQLEEQLANQAEDLEVMSADQVSIWLPKKLDEAIRKRICAIIKTPAGSGKSYGAAKVLSQLAAEGFRVCYATQEHKVAHETRAKLSAEAFSRSVHLHSPLLQVGDEPRCRRSEELTERVFEYGVSLMGTLCPKCPYKDECEALGEAQKRQQKLPDASLVFVSHAGINQVFGVDSNGRQKGNDFLLMVDEMPAAFERVEVTGEDLQWLAEGRGLMSVKGPIALMVRELARAWLTNEEPGDVYFRGERVGNADEMARDLGRIQLRDNARPHNRDREMLRAADSLVRIYCHHADGGAIEGGTDLSVSGVSAMVPDACHQALLRRKGVLLSATPLLEALPDFEMHEAAVADGAPVRRVQVLRARRGSGATLKNYYDDALGERRCREPEPGEEPGIPWPAVDAALARALAEADRIEPGSKVLFCTFKVLADVLRADNDRLAGGRICVGHYGALRGKNDWMEGAKDEVTVCYCYGTPRMDMQATLYHLGYVGEAADQAWANYAAGELAQAEGRLRLPRRTKPCTVFVEGSVAPSSWTSDNITHIQEGDDIIPASAWLEAALRLRTQAEVATLLGVDERSVRRWRQPGRPPPAPEHAELLQKLAQPPWAEMVGLINRANEARRIKLLEDFSWLPLDD